MNSRQFVFGESTMFRRRPAYQSRRAMLSGKWDMRNTQGTSQTFANDDEFLAWVREQLSGEKAL